jgi:sterol carrier protein 2
MSRQLLLVIAMCVRKPHDIMPVRSDSLTAYQGDTTSGQRVFYQFGMTGIPVYNTNNACATGSAGLHLARTLVKNGAADCVLVVGFEQMNPGSIKSVWSDRPSPMGLSTTLMEETRGKYDTPRNAQYFANAGREYMEKYVESNLKKVMRSY